MCPQQAKSDSKHDVLTNEPAVVPRAVGTSTAAVCAQSTVAVVPIRAPAVLFQKGGIPVSSAYPHVREPFDATAILADYKRGERMENICAKYGTYFTRIYKLLFDAKLTMRNGQLAYLTAEEIAVAYRMRKAGTDIKILRLIFDVHISTMRIALTYGSAHRGRGGVTNDLRTALIEMQASNISKSEMARRLRASHASVARWLRQIENERLEKR